MPISFPYPVIGTIVRPAGQGCISCVHQFYCQALYWRNRYVEEARGRLTETDGTACASWSNNPADQIRIITPDDIAENNRLNDEGIMREPFDSGFTEPFTGNERDRTATGE